MVMGTGMHMIMGMIVCMCMTSMGMCRSSCTSMGMFFPIAV
jgi:hypothetical protein